MLYLKHWNVWLTAATQQDVDLEDLVDDFATFFLAGKYTTVTLRCSIQVIIGQSQIWVSAWVWGHCVHQPCTRRIAVHSSLISGSGVTAVHSSLNMVLHCSDLSMRLLYTAVTWVWGCCALQWPGYEAAVHYKCPGAIELCALDTKPHGLNVSLLLNDLVGVGGINLPLGMWLISTVCVMQVRRPLLHCWPLLLLSYTKILTYCRGRTHCISYEPQNATSYLLVLCNWWVSLLW